MTEVAYDIQVLENALIALAEGASDEKRSAIYALERMLDRKTKIIEEFEMQAEAA